MKGSLQVCVIIFHFFFLVLSVDIHVFSGGAMPIKVESVRIIETCRNYKTVFAALYCLDTIVSDGAYNEDNDNIVIPIKLIKQLLNLKESQSCFKNG